MRVIAGKYRSRRLIAPRGLRLRPTSDRLRETLFNILGAAVSGSLFVDGYAGTGAVGIEALSRGARAVFFLEQDPRAARLIRSNLAALAAGPEAQVFAGGVLPSLAALAAQGASADFLFLDPPYRDERELDRALELLGDSPLLASEGILVVEHSRKRHLPERVGRLARFRVLRQGDAALSFYRPAPPR